MALPADNYYSAEQVNVGGISVVGAGALAATAGAVGETIKSTLLLASAVALTTNVTANVTSISLPAGDWDIYGVVNFNPGATTSVTNLVGAISLTSATLPSQSGVGGLSDNSSQNFSQAAAVPNGLITLDPLANLLINATTTVYLVAQGTFTVSTLSAYGSIYARRRR